MFPDFHYLFQSLFGVDLPGLSIIKTFGFFVALGFIAGAWALTKELKRKQAQGLFQPEIITETIGGPVKTSEIIWMFVLGFLVGFKIVGILINASAIADNPVAYLFSLQGNWIAGLLLGGILAFYKYTDKKKQANQKPTQQKVSVYPHQRVADIVFIAAIAGFAGAKLFNAFETWDDFVDDPIGNLISSSGLTYYGGLICATVALYVYTRKKKFSFAHLCDAAAPALLLAYGIGRLGCHFSGDGDWGIYNSAYVTQADASLAKAAPGQFETIVTQYPEAFREFGAPQNVPHKYVPAPSALPDWLFAMNYKNNVNNEGVAIAGDKGTYNHVLAAGVFPTPIYEAFACVLLFLILWSLRKRFDVPLKIFGIYLVMNGLERFLVEKIRVNHQYDWAFNLTQAELISFALILIGLILFFTPKKTIKTTPEQ
jgi:phosphatidylglycerol:prolipoprotein diacylglycerol transferase